MEPPMILLIWTFQVTLVLLVMRFGANTRSALEPCLGQAAPIMRMPYCGRELQEPMSIFIPLVTLFLKRLLCTGTLKQDMHSTAAIKRQFGMVPRQAPNA